MNLTKKQLVVILASAGVIAVAAMSYAGGQKNDAVKAQIDNYISTAAVLVDIKYDSIDTSIFNDNIAVNGLTIKPVGGMARQVIRAGGPSVVNIKSVAIEQNVSLSDLDESVTGGEYPTEFSLHVQGLSSDLTVNSLINVFDSPSAINALSRAIDGQDLNISFNVGYKFKGNPELGKMAVHGGFGFDDLMNIKFKADLIKVPFTGPALMTSGYSAIELVEGELIFTDEDNVTKRFLTSTAEEQGTTYKEMLKSAKDDLKKLKDTKGVSDLEIQMSKAAYEFAKDPGELTFTIEPNDPVRLSELEALLRHEPTIEYVREDIPLAEREKGRYAPTFKTKRVVTNKIDNKRLEALNIEIDAD